MMDLNTVWFLLIGVLLGGYAVLDGFDFGVGILHLLARDDTERRIHLNAIGPVWDGNEVWLITGGGALFAAFPIVYATIFSGFYIALMLLLAALIFRAVSLEFRGKVEDVRWRRFWDWCFGLGSLLPALLLGVALGNVLRGVPINQHPLFTGDFFTLLNPFALLVGLTGFALFVMHGALYMTMKTEGDLRERNFAYASRAWFAFVVLYVLTTLATFFYAPHLFRAVPNRPLFYLFLLLLLAGVVYIPVAIKAQRGGAGFLASSVTILSLMGLAAVSLYPRIVPSTLSPEYTLTIYNASSSQKTLQTMLIIALIGMPLVVAYTIFIYRQFRGKVVLGDHSY